MAAEGERKATTTLYYQQRSPSARPAQARVPAGPAPRLVGGIHTHVYEERPGRSSAPKADASSADALTSTSTAKTAWGESTAGGPLSMYKTKKVVYWTGRDHHIVDAPDVPASTFRWVPPHLDQGDVEPGPQLGVRETAGALRVKLIGSKYRYLPSMEPHGGSMWAVTEEAAAVYGSVGSNTWGSSGVAGPGALGSRPRPLTASGPYGSSLEAYAKQRVVGYKEYEATTKLLHGVASWENTQRHMTGSMDLGRPSKMLAPSQTGTFTGLRAAGR
ncbi:hypothetical protein TSOC_007061 [Tetrabaena socialis]|uniref:Uncharacterized protein n=1 Tax=Tetrabaena socialis TaxID=47790 RepID=A0A2J8A209_9CHLO|nr:hypothetical protein TSOC_007061 [Tetrabaena socialis]|eukprot:PNH06552.1 hypothetical protein TSOC_007061 [Tetrabaena socialis]